MAGRNRTKRIGNGDTKRHPEIGTYSVFRALHRESWGRVDELFTRIEGGDGVVSIPDPSGHAEKLHLEYSRYGPGFMRVPLVATHELPIGYKRQSVFEASRISSTHNSISVSLGGFALAGSPSNPELAIKVDSRKLRNETSAIVNAINDKTTGDRDKKVRGKRLESASPNLFLHVAQISHEAENLFGQPYVLDALNVALADASGIKMNGGPVDFGRVVLSPFVYKGD